METLLYSFISTFSYTLSQTSGAAPDPARPSPHPCQFSTDSLARLLLLISAPSAIYLLLCESLVLHSSQTACVKLGLYAPQKRRRHIFSVLTSLSSQPMLSRRAALAISLGPEMLSKAHEVMLRRLRGFYWGKRSALCSIKK